MLTPELGVEGPALATDGPVRGSRSRSCCESACARPACSSRSCFAARSLPAYAARRGCWPAPCSRSGSASSPSTLPAVALAGRRPGCSPYWVAFYALVLDPDERALVRGLLTASVR